MCMQVYPVHFISSWHKHTPPSHVQSWCAWPCNVPYSVVKPIQHIHWCIPISTISTDQFNNLMCIYIYSIAIYTYIQYIHLYSKLTCDDFIHRPVSLKNCRYPQASRLSNASISPSFFRGYAINWTVCIKNVLKSTHVYSLQGGSPQLCSFMSNPVRYRYVQHMFPFHPG